MSSKLLAILIAAAAGSLMAFQGAMNASLSKYIGLMRATLVVQLTGTLIVLVALIAGLGRGSWSRLTDAPWYTFLGGLLGVLIVYGVAASIPRAGAAIATTAIIAAQVTTALIIDHFGLFGLKECAFTWWKAAGLVLLAVGTKLMLN